MSLVLGAAKQTPLALLRSQPTGTRQERLGCLCIQVLIWAGNLEFVGQISSPAISKVGFDAAAASARGGGDTNTPGKLSKVSWGCAMLSPAQKGAFF